VTTIDSESDSMLAAIRRVLPRYPFDQYRRYPATGPDAWQGLCLERLRSAAASNSHLFFRDGDQVHLVGCRISDWDREHFGFAMAAINWAIHPNVAKSAAVLSRLVADCLAALRQRGIKFVSARVDGDDLAMIHALEAAGFRYYETILYPASRFRPRVDRSGIRFAADDEIDRIADLARRGQYPRGHFYSDIAFDKSRVEAMYEKWIHSSRSNNRTIAVAEVDGRIGGYFEFMMDTELTRFLGPCYGRMTSLALDPDVRGRGIGSRLFAATMQLMYDMGAAYVLSEYATKNNLSSRLHVENRFFPLYESVLFHRWL